MHCTDRFRSGFKYALRWLPCVKWTIVQPFRRRNAYHAGGRGARTGTLKTQDLAG